MINEVEIGNGNSNRILDDSFEFYVSENVYLKVEEVLKSECRNMTDVGRYLVEKIATSGDSLFPFKFNVKVDFFYPKNEKLHLVKFRVNREVKFRAKGVMQGNGQQSAVVFRTAFAVIAKEKSTDFIFKN